MVTLDDILAAAERIRDMVRVTPVKAAPGLSRLAGGPVWLKCEHRQETGAFKLRGASNAAARLGEVITARTGKTETTGTFVDVDATGNLVLQTAKSRVAIPAADVFF